MLRKFDPAISVAIELKDGAIIDISELETYRKKTPQLLQLSRAIHVTASTTAVKIRKRGQNHALHWRHWDFLYTGSIHIAGGQVLDFYFQPDDQQQVPPESCIGLLLFQNRDWNRVTSQITGPQLLILGKIGGRLERIGLAKVDLNSCEVYAEGGKCTCIFPVEDEKLGAIALGHHGPLKWEIPWNWTTTRIE